MSFHVLLLAHLRKSALHWHASKEDHEALVAMIEPEEHQVVWNIAIMKALSQLGQLPTPAKKHYPIPNAYAYVGVASAS